MVNKEKHPFLANAVIILTSTAIAVVIVYSIVQFVNVLFNFKFKQTPQFILCYGFSAFLGAVYNRVNSRG